MIAVLAFDRSELELVRKLARWIVELGGVKEHDILLVPSRRTHNVGIHQEIGEILRPAFKKVSFHLPTTEDETGWPNAANLGWRETVRAVEWTHGDQPFFWFEPDSVPLLPEWIDRIEVEFKACKKPFMGAHVTYPGVPEHMSGCGVYWHTMKWCPEYAVMRFQHGYTGPQVAWDVALAPVIVRNAHWTDLVQHEWKPAPFEDAASLSRLNPKAVLYHQCKDGSLIERLMQRKSGTEGNESGPGLRSDIRIEDVQLEKNIAPSPNTIFTYFAPVENIDLTEQLSLIDLWKFSWRKAGWNPVVINSGFIPAELDALVAKLDALPSTNPAGYDSACFRRWLALAGIGGGWMCDYDVMNNGFEPQPVPVRLTVYQTENACPSLVAGAGNDFLRMATLFTEWGPGMVEDVHGKPHISDMHIIQSMPEEFEQEKIVAAYGSTGWQTAKAIHFANQTMEGKKPRSAWIPRIFFGELTPETPETITGGMRKRLSEITQLIDGHLNRRAIFHAELRRARLLGPVAKRDKKVLV